MMNISLVSHRLTTRRNRRPRLTIGRAHDAPLGSNTVNSVAIFKPSVAMQSPSHGSLMSIRPTMRGTAVGRISTWTLFDAKWMLRPAGCRDGYAALAQGVSAADDFQRLFVELVLQHVRDLLHATEDPSTEVPAPTPSTPWYRRHR